MQSLIRRCQQGDTEAFDEIFTRLSAQVLRTAFFITHDAQEAEDILQDTFLDVHRDIVNLRDPERFNAWLRKITVNHSLRRIRRRRRDISIDEVAVFLVDDSALGVPADQQVVRTERIGQIHEAIKQLTPVQRTVLVMKYFHELLEKDIADAIGCSIGTVKSRLHYAKKQIASILRMTDTPLRDLGLNEDKCHDESGPLSKGARK